MKLIDLREQAPRGTYFGVRPTKETVEAMQDFMKSHYIPNPIHHKDMHATVVFSRAFVNARPKGTLNPTWKGMFEGYDMFPRNIEVSHGEEPPSCLVMQFHCHEMHERHHELRNVYGATHDFSEFKPHMTLTYDAGDFDHNNLPAYDGPHEFDTEYSEPLDLNWAK